MLDLGWFSTGRGEGSLGLLNTVQGAIERGELDAAIRFVFSNREPGEAEGSDRFFQQVQEYGIPLVTLSSRRFRRENGGGPFQNHRDAFDRAAMRLLEGHRPNLCVLAGYMLITGPEMCNRYTLLNLHPALPGGPVGTWQDVVWQVIEQGAAEAGAYIHLATEDLDQGPVVTYCSFPIRGPEFDASWREVQGRTVEEMKATSGEALPLFSLIRGEGVRRERPLLLQTLGAFARGDVRVVERRVLDRRGNTTGGLNLNDAIAEALASEQ